MFKHFNATDKYGFNYKVKVKFKVKYEKYRTNAMRTINFC